MKEVLKAISEKKTEQSKLLDQLEKREALIVFLCAHGIHVDKDSRFRCGAVGVRNKLVAVKVNGVEHRINTDVTVDDYHKRYVP